MHRFFEPPLSFNPIQAGGLSGKILSPNHLIFLPLKKETLSLEFVLLDDQKGEIIPESFYLQVYNKEDECIR